MTKKLLALLFVSMTASAFGQSCTTPFTDNFSGTGALGSQWLTPLSAGGAPASVTKSSGTAVSSGAGIAILNNYCGVFPAAQSVTGSYPVSADYSGPTVRMNTSGNGYAWLLHAGGVAKISGGTGIGNVLTCPPVSAGDNWTLTIDASNLITCRNNTTGLQAIATDTTYGSGYPGIFVFSGAPIGPVTITSPSPQAAQPTFSPVGPRLPTGGSPITIACSTTSPTMYYTTNGTTPTTSSTLYTGPVSVTTNTTLKAICTSSGYVDSFVTTQNYTVGSVTWYVDPVNGGTRYSAANTSGQCNGTSASAYVSGVNQNCPYNDARLLWNDPYVYNDSTWVLIGGDIVQFNNTGSAHPTQMSGAESPAVLHCSGIGPSCSSPPVPSGTLSNPTTFRGENYANCTVAGAHGILHPDPTKTAYLWAGGGSSAVFDVSTTQHASFSCLDLTDHAACNGITLSCSGLEWSGRGFWTGNIVPAVNGDITMNAVNIHGFQSRGIIGNLGGAYVLTAVDIFANGSAGWDFDPALGQDSHNGTMEMHEGLISWNGCTEEYPIVDAIPIQPNGCTDQNNGGYGDGVGTPGTNGLISMWFDHVESDYNTQDAIDLGHMLSGTIKFTRNFAQGNMGGTFKSGNPTFDYVYDNVSMGNCQRMKSPITGAPTGFNNGLSLWCRSSGDNMSINWDPSLGHTLTADWQFNTISGYAATMVDPQCGSSGSPVACTGVTWNYSNNVMLAYTDTDYNSGQAPGWGNSMSPTTQTKNWWYGTRFCYAAVGDLNPGCTTSPAFVSQPSNPVSDATDHTLDNFNFYPNTGSGLIHTGTYSSSIPLDFYNVTKPNPPTVGAAEPSGGTPTANTPTFSPVAGTYGTTQSVTILTTSGGVICYNTTGSPATNGTTGCTTGTLYTAPVSVASSETLYAVAGGSGYLDSAVGSAAYVIATAAATPTFAPGAGSYGGTQAVTLSTTSSGCTGNLVWNTTNAQTGGNLTGTSSTNPASVTSSATVYAQVQGCSGFTNSAIGSANYTINGTAATPVASPVASTYTSTQNVILTTSTGGSSICYTVDGSTPTATSPGACSHGSNYISPIVISSTTTLKAITTNAVYTNSALFTGVYTINSTSSGGASAKGNISMSGNFVLR